MEFRGFIAADVEIPDKIREISNELKNTGGNLKLVEPEKMHLTLKFLGDTHQNLVDPIENIMKESVENIEPFEIKLKGLGVFPNENYIKVIWVGIEPGKKLKEIANNLNEKLSNIGFKKEKREYTPHLTIARVKSGRKKDEIIKVINKYKRQEFVSQVIDKLELKKSELTSDGPIYSNKRTVEI
ncbi:MAG: RNA 2',3'-cyclic phosphodiesterase [Candidatus Thermoplasmatota archaeon]